MSRVTISGFVIRVLATSVFVWLGYDLLLDKELQGATAQRSTRKGSNSSGRGASDNSGEPRGVWLGQDGEDRVGPSAKSGANEIQDIHVRLAGLGTRPLKRILIQGLGGDAWSSNGDGGWFIAVDRPNDGPVADLYLEPARKEDGRAFEVKLWFEDGGEAGFWLGGGKADPNKRVAGAGLQAEWGGQGPIDRVGEGPSIGPDGIRDARIVLSKLSDRRQVRSVRIEGPGGLVWESGKNPEGVANAELRIDPKDRRQGEVFIQPAKPLTTAKLNVTVTYDDNSTDKASLKAERFDPKLTTSAPTPFTLMAHGIRPRWSGQDGQSPGSAGDVHVVLENLPGGRGLRAIGLSNSMGTTWSWQEGEVPRFRPGPYSLPIRVRRGPEANAIHLGFPPTADEDGLKLSARLVFDDGKSALVEINGGPSDPALRSATPSILTISAKPGDDLQKMVESAGIVNLAAGQYELTQPLRLTNAVQIIGAPGSVLRFRQQPQSEPWTTAIKIHRGNTRLEGFAVRFAGPVVWKSETQYGPAIIGSPDNFDQGNDDPKAGIALVKLDLEAPPARSPDAYEEAPGLARLVTASSGRIEGCILRGGMIQVTQGPWFLVDNDYRGTAPGTFSWNLFSLLNSHQVTIKGNRTRAVEPAGKTWRFLVQSRSGACDEIAENHVEGIGARDDDRRSDNAPEIMLTEAYRLHYVGRVASLSKDGRILQVAEPQGEPAGPGDVVAVVAGPNAGEWVRITHAVDPTTFLVDPPLPRDSKTVSIATGFVNETYRDNEIDTRGGTVVSNLVVVGNHYGLKVRDNHFLGGNMRITASPTEEPVHWGWAIAPTFGAEITGNILEDQARLSTLGVERDGPIKVSRDRVYFTGTFRDNRFIRSTSSSKPTDGKNEGIALRVNDVAPLDPGEARITEQGTTVTGGPARIAIHGATWNGKVVRESTIEIPKAGGVAENGKRARR